MNKSLLVTKPLFPESDKYKKQIDDIWEAKWLSNNGSKHIALESQLKSYIQADNLSLFNNGTIALLTALQSLRLQGEVITTPFTFPATSHVLSWNNLEPVFCDIDYQTMTIDPQKIESKITSKTSAILGVHVYGIPCHVNEIQEIADRHGLKVVYDAAHAFTTTLNNRPIAEFGDITMFSFHPTKLFHTGEGGALVYKDSNMKQRIEYLKNFGIKNENEVVLPGINGKMNELQASLGLEVLPLVKDEQAKRAVLRELYKSEIKNNKVKVVEVPQGVGQSQQYFCIRILSGKEDREIIYDSLKHNNVFARKYFYPLVSDYPCYSHYSSASQGNLKVAKRVSEEVLCLPFYSDLSFEDVRFVADIINNAV